MDLGRRYKELRQTLKDESGNTVSIKALAEKMELAASRISELENNKREMSLTELKAYHKFFNVSFEYLLGETDISSANEDIQTACKVTGLSEKAIHKLMKLKNDVLDYDLCPVISGIIESKSFTALIESIWFMRESSLSKIYTQDIKEFFHEIIENNEFSLDIREYFFKRFANCFGYSAESLYCDSESRGDNKLSWTDLYLPENYGLMRVPKRFNMDAQNAVELHEYHSTKQFQHILEEYMNEAKKEYPCYKLRYNELVKKLYRYERIKEDEDVETEEEKRFGEYIRALLDMEENDGEHNPKKE